jgi:predicted PurR-regulated permease PerM
VDGALARRLRFGGRPLPKQSQVFFFVILGFLLFMTWLVFQVFFIWIVTGIFVAVLSIPLDKFWERFLPNRWAAAITMVTLVLIITVPLVLLGVAMTKDVMDLANSIDNGTVENALASAAQKPWAQDALSYVYPGQNETQLNTTVRTKLDEGVVWLQGQLTAFGNELVRAVPDFFIGLVVVMFVVYYILVDGERFVAYIRRAAPLPARQIDFLMREARNGLSAVFVGQIFTSIIQGVLGGIAFWITGLPNPVLWGAVMALFALLPVLGTFMVWIPGAAYLLMQENYAGAIFMMLWGIFVVTILTDNFLRPRLIGNRADIHPMFVLVGVLGGAAVFGFVGLFLGPLIVGVTIAVLKVYEADYLDPNVNLLDEVESHHVAETIEAHNQELGPPKRDDQGPLKGGPL